MRTLTLVLAFAAVALPGAPAAAGTPVTEKMKCPIGGQSFDFETTGSYTTFGSRPDGKPYGSWQFPLAVPECPDNGLVLYKEYSAEEVAKLEPLVASEAYQALRKADTSYYRAYWLMREMGLGPERYLWALLQATWQADGKPELKKRYQTELAEASAKVEPKPASLDWLGMEGRAINALRELGRFDEALARLDKLSLAALEAAPAAKDKAGGPADKQAASRTAWSTFFKSIRPVIERRDSSSEPIDMVPRRVAHGLCIDNEDTLGEVGTAVCAKEAAAVEELRAVRTKLAKEQEALKRSREASGR
jgi:hypothetical protein